MNKLADTFRKSLAARLIERGAKSDLARATGFARLSIDRWLSGETTPTLEDAEALARAVGCEPIDLLFPGARPQASSEDIEKGVEAAILAGRAISLERFQRMQAELIRENEALRAQLDQALPVRDPRRRELLRLVLALSDRDFSSVERLLEGLPAITALKKSKDPR